MTIDQLSEKRKKLRQQLIDNEAMDGFKELLTVLYSDKVHFIYELLQNAEDARATEVQFILDGDGLEFEHNGDRLFKIKDVESITNIGSSTKVDDDRSIGEFGIGFKSVFAYTATPEIESGDFHFRIHDMFVPDTEGLAPGALGEKRTQFIFPFNNPEKTSEEARHEVETKLRHLNEDALLFLNNINKIEYCLPNLTSGSVERKQNPNDENQIEISVKHPGHSKSESTYYLRFTKDVNIQDDGKHKECRIAIAFGMDISKDERWKIKPLNRGQVCIYFPAVKETSNLRFHFHAPFASTVARDSVRECSANDDLRDHLAELIAESMHAIRDRGLLDVEFLAALPNDKDNLSDFYLPIKERLIEEFDQKKLVPMKRRRSEHAAASGCYRTPPGYRALSDLVNDEDLAILLEKDRDRPLWIANPPQINQPEDNFLSMLDIALWDPEELIKIINTQSNRVMELLRKKTVEWHQDMYGFLGDFLINAPSSPLYARERQNKLSNLCIILCSDSEYRIGSECHFLDDVEFEFEKERAQLEEFHYVAKGVYSSGQNENKQQKAREFLEKIGVCEVDETERIKAILRQRYEDPNTAIPPQLHVEDMKRFIALVESDSAKADLFKNYPIFNTTGGDGFKADLVFLDLPYLETGLRAYYEDSKCDIEFLEECGCVYFSLDYEESDIDPKELGKFAEALGAKTKLEVTKQEILSDHPQFYYLRSAPGSRWTYTGIDEDYSIPEFPILVANPSIVKSKLIWQAMCSAPDSALKSRFRWNQSYSTYDGTSSLVHGLKGEKWVPQKNGESISFVRPKDASITLLPEGFPYNTGQKWLDAIEFGETAKRQRAEDILKQREQNTWNQRAKEFGFDSADEANTMAKIANDLKEEGKTPGELLKKRLAQKRRKELLIIELDDAEEKEFETRARSIRSSRSRIEPKITLRAQYTTDENSMLCQMCSKSMPFKKRNSDEDYFEAVEALGKGYFFKEHEAQYLALCPECAAEYKEYVKKDPKARETFHDALKNSDNPQIHLESHGRAIRIWFEDKHWLDLKTVLYYYENVYDPNESD